MESLMIQKLREALANTTKAEFQREWAEIQAMGLKGPTVSELLAYQRPPASYLPDNSGEGGDSSAVCGLVMSVFLYNEYRHNHPAQPPAPKKKKKLHRKSTPAPPQRPMPYGPAQPQGQGREYIRIGDDLYRRM